MKLPRTPPDLDVVLQQRQSDVLKALSNPAYLDFTQRLARYYPPWDKLRHKAIAKHLDPDLAWVVTKFGRIPQMRILPLRGSLIDVRFTLPDLIQQELMEIDQGLAGQLGSITEQPLTHSQRERFIISSLQEEAIASSMLEGAATTRREAKKMLRTQREPVNKSEWMVLNNYMTIQHVREHLDDDLTPEFLLEIQEMLTKNAAEDPSSVGRFRNSNDTIEIVDHRDNVTVHTPPDARELRARMKGLCAFANTDHRDPFIHPVIKACILHFQIGFDHPFCDGNGRTARAVFYWSMLRDGYWLFEFLPISRLIYASPISYARAYLYTETDDFDLTYFLLYKLRIVSIARQELRKYVEHKQRETADARRMFRSNPDFNQRQQETVMRFVRDPEQMLTIKDHQHRFRVVYETARQDLMELAANEYLVQERIGKRYVFTAGPKLDQPPTRLKRGGIRSPIPRTR